LWVQKLHLGDEAVCEHGGVGCGGTAESRTWRTWPRKLAELTLERFGDPRHPGLRTDVGPAKSGHSRVDLSPLAFNLPTVPGLGLHANDGRQ
jgi:hypothetical protein